MALKISEEAAVQMPMKTVASLIAMVAIGTWAYFGIIETQNKILTQVELMTKDLTENTEFRIKWPRGQLGSLPADSEQFMMIEDLYKTTDKLNAHIESMALNKVNIEFLTKQMDKVLTLLVGLLIALGGWSLSRTFELSTGQAVLEKQVEQLEFEVRMMDEKMEEMFNMDEEIMEQHKKLFEKLDQGNTGYSYN